MVTEEQNKPPGTLGAAFAISCHRSGSGEQVENDPDSLSLRVFCSSKAVDLTVSSDSGHTDTQSLLVEFFLEFPFKKEGN